jgi:O-antigen/teichoic acid export membrane protein
VSQAAPAQPAAAPQVSRARRVMMTGVWSAALQVVSAVTQLLTVPFFLQAWSSGTYDDWIALTALVSVLQYADGGMQSHVVNLLTRTATQERWDEFRADLASATLMYALAGAVAVLGTGALCGWLVFSGHFHGRALEHQALAITALLGLQVALQLTTGLLTGLYRIFGRADLSQLVILVLRVALLAGTLIVLVISGNPMALAALQLALYGLLFAWLFIDTRRREPHAALGFRGADLKRAIGFLGPSLQYLLVSVSQGLTQSGTVLVIDWLRPLALVPFSTTRMVASVVRQVIGLFTNSLWPELTRLDAQGDRAKFALAHRVLVKLTCSVALPVTAALLFSGTSLYRVWTRGKVEPDPLLLRLLLIEVLVVVPGMCSSYVLMATSRIRDVSRLYAVNGVAQVVLAAFAVKFIGVWGVGLVVLLLAVVVHAIPVPIWALRVVGESWASYVRGVYVPYAIMSLATVGATGAMHRLLQALGETAKAVVVRACLDGMAALLCTALLSWLLLLNAQERTFLLSTARSLLGRRAAKAALASEPSP